MRNSCEVGFYQAFEFQKRLVVEYDVFDAIEATTAFPETIGDRFTGESRIVLDPRKALFLCCRNDPPVLHEGRSTVMIECRDAKYTHGQLLRITCR